MIRESGYWFVVIGYWQKLKTNNQRPKTKNGGGAAREATP
jgi:hypothetical protein